MAVSRMRHEKCAVYPLFNGQITEMSTGTVRSLWTWLWDRYRVPHNVLLVLTLKPHRVSRVTWLLNFAANFRSSSFEHWTFFNYGSLSVTALTIPADFGVHALCHVMQNLVSFSLTHQNTYINILTDSWIEQLTVAHRKHDHSNCKINTKTY